MIVDFSLFVFIEINGSLKKAGTISGTSSSDAVFKYDANYISDFQNHPISISFPFSEKNFSSSQTKNYFEGLLPEGFTRKCVADSIHVDSEDYISILKELGKECLGAIQIVQEDEDEISFGYKSLTKKEVKALASEGATTAANIVVKSHLSLTGASGKVGLYFDEKTKKWYKPFGSAPSNYIVKQSHVRLNSIVVNEQLCLLTAKKLGIDVPESFIIQSDNESINDETILFATKRFDRYTDENSSVFEKHTIPYRLHQEDFAQAMGIKSAEKYEKAGGNYLKKMFQTLSAYSSNPIEDQLKLWKICIFNYFIGNTDNHIKNYSLLYTKDLNGVRLAPCYDVISTKIYNNSTTEMSLSINGKYNINEISKPDFEAEAKNVGLGKKLAMNIFDEVQSNFELALNAAADELEKSGFVEAKKIAKKIK